MQKYMQVAKDICLCHLKNFGYFTSKYHGSNYLECVYDKYDETRLRTLHASSSNSNDKALTFSDLKTKFQLLITESQYSSLFPRLST